MDATIHLKPDCRHFRHDRACAPHKREGVECGACGYYDPVDTRVLIVKLDALGDVLRTTALLKPLKAAYPNSYVIWLTRPSAVSIFDGNPLVDEIISLTAETLIRLQIETFDLVLNPDAAPESCRIATYARTTQRRGFVIDERGQVQPTNATARAWYEMGINDRLKKQNERTYQSILLDMCNLAGNHEILWYLSDDERSYAAHFAQTHCIDPRSHQVIGLNTGAGERWKYKKWTLAGYSEMILRLLAHSPDARILLYGGPAERERNEQLAALDPARVIDTGGDNTLRRFGALLSLSDVVVTGDTLALHLALALGKHVVALFGPTSDAEIDVYARGEKLVPQMDCLRCYLPDCAVRPTCMDNISVDVVLSAVVRQLHAVRPFANDGLTTEVA